MQEIIPGKDIGASIGCDGTDTASLPCVVSGNVTTAAMTTATASAVNEIQGTIYIYTTVNLIGIYYSIFRCFSSVAVIFGVFVSLSLALFLVILLRFVSTFKDIL